MLSIRPVVSSTKLFAIAIILSTSAAARDSTAAALVLFFCICIALASPSKAMQPHAPQAVVPASLSPPYPHPPFSFACLQPITKCFNVRQTLMLLPRSICNILVACHVAKGNAAKAESPILPTHSLTHSFIQSFIQTLMQLSFIQTAVDAAMNALPVQGAGAEAGGSLRRLGKYVRTYVENK